jgi:hypothetical protein
MSSSRALPGFGTAGYLLASLLIFTLGFPALARGQAGAEPGVLEFVARVTPASGRSEPALRQTFFLLRKSFRDVRKEAEETEPKPDLDKFVDGLEVSKELKAWMKRTRTIQVGSEEFLKHVKKAEVLEVPEFENAYILNNAVNLDMGFPRPKFREKDKKAHPDRYEREHKAYMEKVRVYLDANPKSIEGMELNLSEMDPTPRWVREQAAWQQRVHELTLELAQTRHLVAKTDTDLEGRGTFRAEPGTYWISTLEGQAMAGEVRLGWDVPVVLEAGRINRIELSNINAVRPGR